MKKMHRYWNFRIQLLLVGMTCITPALVIGAPHIESSRPPSFVQGTSEMQNIILTGSDLAAPGTNGYTFDADVQVYMRDSWGAFQHANVIGWSGSVVEVEFRPDPWLLNPGILEFKVVVRGVESNVFQVPVSPKPTEPPILLTVFPNSIVLDPNADHFHYIVKVFGKNVDDLTFMSIGGVEAQHPLQAPGEGWVQAQVPDSLWSHPGRYDVQLHNNQGSSNLGVLELTPIRGTHEKGLLPQPAPSVEAVPKEKESKAAQAKAGLAEEVRASMNTALANEALGAQVVDALKLHLSALQPKIQVSAAGGLVTLTGTVPSAADKGAVERVVTGVPGVARVQNNLQVVAEIVIQYRHRSQRR